METRFSVSWANVSLTNIGGTGDCDFPSFLKIGAHIFQSIMAPPRMLSTPTSIVRGETSISGMIQEVIPSAANSRPRKIMSHERGNGPSGVFPKASI